MMTQSFSLRCVQKDLPDSDLAVHNLEICLVHCLQLTVLGRVSQEQYITWIRTCHISSQVWPELLHTQSDAERAGPKRADSRPTM